MRVCGTCSICSGPVTVPSVWMGIYPPTPECAHCKAVPVQAHGAVIPMKPAKRVKMNGIDYRNNLQEIDIKNFKAAVEASQGRNRC